MKTIPAGRFCDLLDEINADMLVTIHTDYSGRSMRGETCVAIEYGCDSGAMIEIACDLMCHMEPGDEREAVRRLLPTALYDSMGHNTIAYWPRLKTSEDA